MHNSKAVPTHNENEESIVVCVIYLLLYSHAPSHLAAEGAGVLRMLLQLHLLHYFTQRRAITRAVLPHNSDLRIRE